jgi:hypothetical protein
MVGFGDWFPGKHAGWSWKGLGLSAQNTIAEVGLALEDAKRKPREQEQRIATFNVGTFPSYRLQMPGQFLGYF